MITVVAALIQHQGRLLICQRRKDDSFPLKWEFPGGKVKVGETPSRALERELEEELGVKVLVGRELYRTRHRYAEYPEELELIFFCAQVPAGAIRNLAFEQTLWVEPELLTNFDFLPADRELVRLLAAAKV